MNQKEWKKSGKFPGKYIWYNKTRKIQKSLKYNSDEKANRIHHLRDTEEQRKYNDEHYELWGHNLDGSFEYGKYVIFVTEEWHNNYHAQSEETRQKIIEAHKKYWNDERRQQVSYRMKKLFKDNPELHPAKGKHYSEATKQKMSESHKGDKCYWYGKHLSKEHKEKLSSARLGKYKGENNPMCGKHHSDESKKKMSEKRKGTQVSDELKKKISDSCKNKMEIVKEKYIEHKSNGGTMTWNEFQKWVKQCS